MKTSAVRLIAIILCAIIITGLFTVLFLTNSGEAGQPGDSSPSPSASGEPSAGDTAPALAKDDVMIEFSDGRSVKAAEYVYHAMHYKLSYENGYGVGAALWDTYPEAGTQVLAFTDQILIQLYASESFGAEYGFALNDEQLKQIDDDIELLETQYGEGYFETFLAQYGVTEEEYREFQTRQLYLNEFSRHYIEEEVAVSDADVDARIAEQYMSAKHICIMNGEGEDTEENRALIDGILERLRNGEDFDTLREEYSEDRDAEENINMPDGYTFDANANLVPVFISTTEALEIGEISEVVENTDGGYHSYHIIMRIEPNRADVAESVLQTLQAEVYMEALMPYYDALEAANTEKRNALVITGVVAFS